MTVLFHARRYYPSTICLISSNDYRHGVMAALSTGYIPVWSIKRKTIRATINGQRRDIQIRKSS